MRLWIISSSYPRDPAESLNAGVLARDLALTYASEGHEVVVITPDKPGGVNFDESLEGITIRWWRPTVTLSDLSASPIDLARASTLLASGTTALVHAARRRRPDRIVALWGIPSGLFARAVHTATGVPYSVWLLGSDVWEVDRYPLGRAALRSVLQHSTGTFADGDSLASEATVITGVPVSTLYSARRLPSRPPRERRDVLFVGRYHPNKGPDVLLAAAASEAFRASGIRLTMRGDGGMHDQLRRMVSQLSAHAADLGGPATADEVAELMSTHRVLVIPSRADSIPLVLGDAISARIPVVATNVGDLGTFVDRYGLGATVTPDDTEQLAGQMIRIHEEPPMTPDWDGAARLLSLDAAAQRLVS